MRNTCANVPALATVAGPVHTYIHVMSAAHGSNLALSPRRLWVIRQMIYGEFLRHIDQVFTESGIRYMPLKGAYLLCTGLAARIPERRMLDIDILVEPRDFTSAVRRIVALPAVRERPGDWPFEREFYHVFAGHTVELELHSALNYDERFRLPAAELFARGVRAEGMRVLPSAEDALLVAVAHALVHIVEGLDTARFGEYRLLASEPTLRWPRFWEYVSAAGIRPFAELLLEWSCRAGDENPPWGRAQSLRARAAAACLRPQNVHAMPRWLRRALLELPFVRRPLGLLALGIARARQQRP